MSQSEPTPQPTPQPTSRPELQPVAVVGVDTHTDTHTAVLLSRNSAVLAQTVVTADPAGAAQLLAWATQHTPTSPDGQAPLWWAVEGTRSHGIGLTRHLHHAGQHVLEAPRPSRRGRRHGKSDHLDATAAARAVLTTLDTPSHHGPQTRHTTLAQPRADGDREHLRQLLVLRRHYTDQRTATVNLLKSLILTAPDELREHLRGRTTTKQITTLLNPTPDQPTHSPHLTDLATDIRTLDQRLRTNQRQLTTLITTLMPTLLTIHGVGPVTAAVLLTTWSHPGRVRSEAAYAALAGVNPIPASSGRTDRHRLNRGGDRTLNAALHTITLTRRRTHQPTIDYVNRRRTDPNRPRTNREITRSLKRYLARHLYRHMQTQATP